MPIATGWNFFWGHIFFLIWVFLQPFVGRKITARKSIILLFVLSCFSVNILLTSSVFYEHRVLQDSFKVIILFISIFIIKECTSEDTVKEILKFCIILFPFIFSLYFTLIKGDDWFSYSGRLYDPLFGSPNVFGAFSALALLYLIFQRHLFPKPIFVSAVVFYTSLLLISFSRASIIALLIATALPFIKKISTAIIFISIISISVVLFFSFQDALPEWVTTKANLINDIQETGGSNRLLIWKETLDSTISDPITMIFGGGPGRIIIDLQWASVDHPHNFYLFVFWAYGLVGLTIFLVYWLTVLRTTLRRSAKGDQLSFSIFIFYTVAFLMDTHILSAQYLALHVLFLALISIRTQRKNKL